MSQSDSKQSARPSKVTLGASLGGASCFVLIFTLFDTLGRLRGVEMRSSIEEQLAEPPFDTLGLSAEQVLEVMRAVAFVDGALAAAGLVLSVFLFRRHQGARYGFSAVALLLLLTAPVAGLLAFLTAAAAVMLWSEESRAWFAGREPRPARERGGSQESSSSPGGWPFAPGERHGASDRGDGEAGTGAVGGSPPTSPSTSAPQPPAAGAPQPPPYSGSFAESGSQQSGVTAVADAQEPEPGSEAQPTDQATSQQPGLYGAPGSPYFPPSGPQPGSYGAPPRSRPGTVTAAAVLTFLGSLLGLGLGLLLLVALAADPEAIQDAVRKDPSFETLGWDVDQVIAVLWFFGAVLVGWSIIGLLLGVFVMRRQTWARWTLLVSALMTALLSLMAILSFVSAIPLIMGAVTVGLLLSRSARAWFSDPSDTPPYQGPSGPPPSEPPSQPQWSSRPGPW